MPKARMVASKLANTYPNEQETTMPTMTANAVTGATLKRAIESRDAAALSSFYADDASLQVIDRNNPPSKPRIVRGKPAIAAFFDDICSRAITHDVKSSVTDGNRLAFTQACAYPDGTRVLCMAMIELKAGKIAQQTMVQAWDE
jgi:ketosteroid isomerase-like protein